MSEKNATSVLLAVDSEVYSLDLSTDSLKKSFGSRSSHFLKEEQPQEAARLCGKRWGVSGGLTTTAKSAAGGYRRTVWTPRGEAHAVREMRQTSRGSS